MTILNSSLHLMRNGSHKFRLLNRPKIPHVAANELFCLRVNLNESFSHGLSLSLVETPVASASGYVILFRNSIYRQPLHQHFFGDVSSLLAPIIQVTSLCSTFRIKSYHLLIRYINLATFHFWFKSCNVILAFIMILIYPGLFAFRIFRDQTISSVKLRSFDKPFIFKNKCVRASQHVVLVPQSVTVLGFLCVKILLFT